MASMLAGGLAGGCTISMVYPLDFARTKLSTDVLSGGKRKYKGLFDVFTKVIKTEGIAGCYRGISAALTGVFLNKAITLGCFDYLKQTVLKGSNIGFIKKFLIANAVTQFSGLALYPIDTVGRKLMIESGNKHLK